MNILNTIGNTPLLNIEGIYAKLETYNPTGSVKDRAIWYMVKKAEERGELKQGYKIIEVTSGNTGIALAMISAVRGYKFTAIMPDSMSIERIKMIKAYGAEIILTPGSEDVGGAVKKYEEIIKNESDSVWLPRQFENPDNIEAHELGLGREIVEQTSGTVDALVAGVGTGGTLIGVALALKNNNPNVKIFAVEPEESAVMSGGIAGLHKIQGIGDGFIPKIIQDNLGLIDGVIKVSSREAVDMQKKLVKKHGLLVGISSGANMVAANKIKEKFGQVVTILPDRGERYLSKFDPVKCHA